MDNGLSVQGDEVAEIVFFEIDRYYDATDLYETNIAIEWEIGSGNTKVAGYTPAFIKTTHDFVTPDDKDKVIFGWPITSEITAQAGKMQFSVRFYNEYNNNDNYDYSLRTLPAIININQGLAIDPLKIEADDASELILRRIVNSRKDGTYGNATIPVIVYTKWEDGYTFPAITEKTILAVLANGGTRSGTLSYAWYRDGAYLEELPWQTLNEKSEYIQVADFVPTINTYYIEKSVDSAITIMDEVEFAKELDAAGALYVKAAAFVLIPDSYDAEGNLVEGNAVAGTYTVDVQNRFYTTEAYASDADTEEKKACPIWIISGPDKLIVVEGGNLPEYFTINGTALKPELTGTSTETTYQWKHSVNNTEDSYVDILGATTDSYIPEDEGYYKLCAKNKRNKKTEPFESASTLALKAIEDFEVRIALNDDGHTLTATSVTVGRDLASPKAYENNEIVWRYRSWGGDWTTIDGGLTLDITEYLGKNDDVQFEFIYNIVKGNLSKTESADYTLKAQV